MHTGQAGQCPESTVGECPRARAVAMCPNSASVCPGCTWREVTMRSHSGVILGWVNSLRSERSAADLLIRRENPEVTQDELDRGVAKPKELGIVDSGHARTQGIGAIDPARVRDSRGKMVKPGCSRPGTLTCHGCTAPSSSTKRSASTSGGHCSVPRNEGLFRVNSFAQQTDRRNSSSATRMRAWPRCAFF